MPAGESRDDAALFAQVAGETAGIRRAAPTRRRRRRQEPERRQRITRHNRHRRLIDLDALVERAHLPLVETSAQLAERGDRIAILKAQRREPAHTESIAKLARHPAKYVARASQRLLTKNREQARTGVFRIDVNRAGTQRAERDLRRAKPGPAINPHAAR